MTTWFHHYKPGQKLQPWKQIRRYSQKSLKVLESCFWQEGQILVSSSFDDFEPLGADLLAEEKVVKVTGMRCFML